MDNPSGKTDHVWIKSLRSENAALRTKVKELEEFVKHDYMSMKNWHEEKAALQAEAVRLKEHYSLQVGVIGGKDNYIESLRAELEKAADLFMEQCNLNTDLMSRELKLKAEVARLKDELSYAYRGAAMRGRR